MPERYKEISVKSDALDLKFKAKPGYEFEIEIVDGVFNLKEVKKEAEEFFCLMDEEKERTVEEWLKNTEATEATKKFRSLVEKALTRVNYDYSISTTPPIVLDNERIVFDSPDKKYQTTTDVTPEQWEHFALNYSEEHGSTISTLCEVVLWYAWRCANGEISEESITTVSDDALFEQGRLVKIEDTKAYVLMGYNNPEEPQKNAMVDLDFIITPEKLKVVKASVTLLKLN